jgi:hypothetical protein
MEAQSGAMEAQSGAVLAHPAAVVVHNGAVEVHQEAINLLRIQINMNVKIGTEAAQFLFWKYFSNFRYCDFEVQHCKIYVQYVEQIRYSIVL